MKAGMSLADIALICGFADQSHFTRVFSASTGLPPGPGAAQLAMQVLQRDFLNVRNSLSEVAGRASMLRATDNVSSWRKCMDRPLIASESLRG